MKHLLMISVVLLTLAASVTLAAGPQTQTAGKYTVTLATQPDQPAVGDTTVMLTVKDGDKPLKGAVVSLHLDMVGMSMPADVKASPGTADGEYVAKVNLGMAGQWKITAAVNAMAGMTMDGDGKADFTVTAQAASGSNATTPAAPVNTPAAPANTPAAPAGLPWPLIIGVVVVVGIVVVVVIARGRPKQTPAE